MKQVVIILVCLAHFSYAQKTTRQTISETRQVSITRNITDSDTIYYMMGQNAKYTHIIDIVILKRGSAADISNLLTECMKFSAEAQGTSLEYQGNTLMSMGGKRVMLFGMGRDDMKYIVLNPGLITRLQTDIQPHL